jgi:hypothetical protein
LPGLKCGTCFSGTGTFSPVFGFQPIEATIITKQQSRKDLLCVAQ